MIFSFEISDGILRNQKFFIGLDSFSNQLLYFWLCLDYSVIYNTSDWTLALFYRICLSCHLDWAGQVFQ